MRLLFIFILVVVCAQAKSVLIINSNLSIVKYKQAQEAFVNNFDGDVKSIDISKMKQKDIKEYLYDEYPDIVYTIGSRAYQYAYKYIPERKIFFSNILNWKRLSKKKNYAGVLNELYSGMRLTMIRSICVRSNTIGLFYSEYTKDVVKELIKNSTHVGIKIVVQKIKSFKDINIEKLLHKSDALILISDPIVLSNKEIVKDIFTTAKLNKKAVIAYDKLFIKYGAIVSISSDNPTIGAQVASMIESYLKNINIQNIQYPIGTRVVLNKKEAFNLGFDIQTENLLNVDELIE